MVSGIVIDGVAGWVALIVPLAALFTAIALAARRRRVSRAKTPPKSTGRYGQPAGAEPTSARDEVASASIDAKAPSAQAPGETAKKPSDDGWFPKVVGRAQRRYASKTEPKFPDGAKVRSPEALKTAIERAERNGEQAKLPSLFIALASYRLGAGDMIEASDLLRKSIRLSASLGRDDDHARARLELGDIARAAGDLTTACEHWQIARKLYQDLSRTAELASAESRMSDHGCPTDWVLNDF